MVQKSQIIQAHLISHPCRPQGECFRVFFCNSTKATVRSLCTLQATRTRTGVQRRCDAHHRAGRRLGCGGPSRRCSARTSLSSGGEPSTLAAPWRGNDNSEAAKDLAAAKARNPDHRCTLAAVLLARRWGGADRARVRARSRTNWTASALQRPATSMASTTSRHRGVRNSSGYVRSLLARAMRRAAPTVLRWCRRVVSTASWTPPQRGSPLAITSMRRSSCPWVAMLRSRRRTLAATVAPASLQMRAAARSCGGPRSSCFDLRPGGTSPATMTQRSCHLTRGGCGGSRIETSAAKKP